MLSESKIKGVVDRLLDEGLPVEGAELVAKVKYQGYGVEGEQGRYSDMNVIVDVPKGARFTVVSAEGKTLIAQSDEPLDTYKLGGYGDMAPSTTLVGFRMKDAAYVFGF